MAAIPPMFGGDPNKQAEQQAQRNRFMQAIANQLINGGKGETQSAFAPVSHPMLAMAKVTQAGANAFQQNRRQNALTGPMAQLGAPKGLF